MPSVGGGEVPFGSAFFVLSLEVRAAMPKSGKRTGPQSYCAPTSQETAMSLSATEDLPLRVFRAASQASYKSNSETSPPVPSLITRIVDVLVSWLPVISRWSVLSLTPMRSANALRCNPSRSSQSFKGCVINPLLAWDANSSQSLKLAWDADDPRFALAYDANMADHHIRKWRKFRGLSMEQLCDRM